MVEARCQQQGVGGSVAEQGSVRRRSYLKGLRCREDGLWLVTSPHEPIGQLVTAEHMTPCPAWTNSMHHLCNFASYMLTAEWRPTKNLTTICKYLFTFSGCFLHWSWNGEETFVECVFNLILGSNTRLGQLHPVLLSLPLFWDGSELSCLSSTNDPICKRWHVISTAEFTRIYF